MEAINPVNVIYLTTKCNYKCSYCYEHQKSNEYLKDITIDELRTSIDKIISNPHVTEQHTICLFGGEPFLNIDAMKFYMNYIKSADIKTKHGVATNVITNGSLLHLYTNELKEWMKDNKNFFSIDISYDGIFQYRRTKSDITEKNMELLTKLKIPFGISYTISKENSDFHNYTKDLVTIIEKYLHPKYDSRQRIRVNIDNSNISNHNEFMKKITYVGQYLFSKYNVSICSFSCKYCKKCQFTNDSKQYFIPEKTNIVEEMVTNKSFNHFKE